MRRRTGCRGCVVAFLFVIVVAVAAPAQFSGDFQTNVISGVTNDWSGSYYVGSNHVHDVLIIESGGVLSSSNDTYVGYATNASFNSVRVTGPGSVWSTTTTNNVGYFGSDNSLVISNGGMVRDNSTQVGYKSSSSRNSIVITGAGSSWYHDDGFRVGYDGSKNTLLISDGGTMTGHYGRVGRNSDKNTATVTGPGSSWRNIVMTVGYALGFGNTLIITNGGMVTNANGYVGYTTGADGNTVIVTDPDSAWHNVYLCVGCWDTASGNTLIITNGGVVTSRFGDIGYDTTANNNTVVVARPGSVWYSNQLRIGYGGLGNTLILTNGGAVMANDVFLNYNSSASNALLRVEGGSLTATNSLVVGRLGGRAELILNNGAVTANRLLATNGVNSLVTFRGGTLHTAETKVADTQNFFVGDGAQIAVLHLQGGTHRFAEGITVRSNSWMTGCGTVVGVVTNFGTLALSCSSVFNDPVVNHASLILSNGAGVDFNGPFINNGVINAINGVAHFHGGLSGSGVYLEAAGDADGDGLSNQQEDLAGTDPLNPSSRFRVTAVTREGDDIRVTWSAVGGKSYAVQTNSSPDSGGFADLTGILFMPGNGETSTNYMDTGGALASPSRYYRVRLVP